MALTLRRAHHEATADRLEAAVASLLPVAKLTPDDRAAILEVTAEGRPELQPLRTALLDEPSAERADPPT